MYERAGSYGYRGTQKEVPVVLQYLHNCQNFLFNSRMTSFGWSHLPGEVCYWETILFDGSSNLVIACICINREWQTVIWKLQRNILSHNASNLIKKCQCMSVHFNFLLCAAEISQGG